MKKMQRILAMAGVLLLLALYGSTLFFALSGNPNAEGWFKASLFCTIAIPVLLYAFVLVYRYLKDRNRDYDFGKPEDKKEISEKDSRKEGD